MVKSWIQYYFLRISTFPSRLGSGSSKIPSVVGSISSNVFSLQVAMTAPHTSYPSGLQYRYHHCTPSLPPSSRTFSPPHDCSAHARRFVSISPPLVANCTLRQCPTVSHDFHFPLSHMYVSRRSPVTDRRLVLAAPQLGLSRPPLPSDSLRPEENCSPLTQKRGSFNR